MPEINSTTILRDFIYIDKNRMYSLYSQVFEGVVESLAESITSSSQETKKEKKLEETIIDASVKIQNVVLYDHIYNTLEEKLQPKILVIDDTTIRDNIKPGTIIKITGYTTIEDYEHLSYLMQNFNEIGTALATLTLKNKSEQQTLSKGTIDQYAKSNGLVLEKKFTDSMVKIIDKFHGKFMEITVELDTDTLDIGFRAILEEQYLRLSANSIRNLYGYKPCMKWTLVGETTHLSYLQNNRNEKNKTIFASMFESLANVDNSFSKINDKTNNIVRVAPIAVYVEHNRIQQSYE